jgi:hypothetical protein
LICLISVPATSDAIYVWREKGRLQFSDVCPAGEKCRQLRIGRTRTTTPATPADTSPAPGGESSTTPTDTSPAPSGETSTTPTDTTPASSDETSTSSADAASASGDTSPPAGTTSSGSTPVIQATAGAFHHKGTVTISGSGFGDKARAAPVVWDDASGTSILEKWDGAWPNQNPAYNTEYRSAQRSIGLPHARISRYIAGAHYGWGGADAGYNVVFWKNRTSPSYPAYTYMSWYQRIDDAWIFQDNLTPDTDNNIKMSAFSVCCSPYELPNNWYVEYNARPTSRSSSLAWHINDDGSSLQSPDANGRSWWWSGAINPMSGVWTKIEQEIKHSSQSDGYIRLWENGVLKINYAGPTDKYAGTARSEGIGGYARSRSANNWRYFADVYLDYTPARVVLANSNDLGAATVIENQIPSIWGSSSITVTANLGRFAAGQTAYLYVVNASGQRNSPGYPIVVQ